ncbi:MFS transporter [Candidatus Sumerlaeota bacterium]|nr:MFS transporter [Candidatus Sumerlaeota bacterium]
MSARWAMILAVGTFATSLGNPLVIASIPLKSILKEVLHVTPFQSALFLVSAGAAWLIKPLFAIWVDWLSYRFGRGATLLFSAIVAVACWALIAVLPIRYETLLLGFFLVNVAIIIATNLMGGVLVEQSREQLATGRLGSASMAGRHVGYLVAGPLSGYLAGSTLGYTAAAGGAVVGLLIPIAFMIRAGKASASGDVSFRVKAEILAAIRLKSFWAAALIMFLFEIAPGFDTPLYYLQKTSLGFSDEMVGWMQLVTSVGGIVGAILFAFLCSRFSLRQTLYAGVILNALGSLLFYFYKDANSAIVVSLIFGFVGTLSFMPVMDLSARATPGGVACAGFALVMSARYASTHLSDLIGSKLVDPQIGLSFNNLIWINSATTALVVFAIPFIPAFLLNPRDGERATPT